MVGCINCKLCVVDVDGLLAEDKFDTTDTESLVFDNTESDSDCTEHWDAGRDLENTTVFKVVWVPDCN